MKLFLEKNKLLVLLMEVVSCMTQQVLIENNFLIYAIKDPQSTTIKEAFQMEVSLLELKRMMLLCLVELLLIQV